MLLVTLLTGARQGKKVTTALSHALVRAGIVGIMLILGALLLYLPYFLTAQSQAGGILPNLLHPTRLPQFLLMYGHFLLAVAGLLIISWREQRPSAAALAAAVALVVGMPVIFLITTGLLTANAAGETAAIAGQASEFLGNIAERRLGQPWTFLLLGGLVVTDVGLTVAAFR